MHHCRVLHRPYSSCSSTTSTASLGSHKEENGSRPAVPSFEHLGRSRCGRQGSSASTWSRSCEGMSLDDTSELWKCMLELQRRYSCYNSTRIDLALEAGDAGLYFMPNPFIIDTLNYSVVELPEEGWRMLDRCVQSSPTPTKQKIKRKFWSRH